MDDEPSRDGPVYEELQCYALWNVGGCDWIRLEDVVASFGNESEWPLLASCIVVFERRPAAEEACHRLANEILGDESTLEVKPFS